MDPFQASGHAGSSPGRQELLCWCLMGLEAGQPYELGCWLLDSVLLITFTAARVFNSDAAT